MNCNHAPKTLEYRLNDDANFVPYLFGCTKCDFTTTNRDDLFVEDVPSEHRKHTEYTDGCFACKVQTLQLNPGDAGRADGMSQKKWDRELNSYANARSQGIQPAGTTEKAVREAMDASQTLGRAYNAESMPAATKITKQTAQVMKETGVA